MRMMVMAALVLPGVAAAQSVQPGQWDIAVTTESMSMPDLPPEVAAQMRGKTVHVSHCITPAEAAQGMQEMLKSRKECRIIHYTGLGGHLHSEISCAQPGGGSMSSVSDGTFTPTGFTAHGKTVMTGANTMTVVATTVGKRVGPCTGK